MSVSMQKKRLGRGLDYWGIDKLATAEGQRMVALAELRPSRFNPRRSFSADQLEELATSIRERGLVQPIVVRPTQGEAQAYEIVAGERRVSIAAASRSCILPCTKLTLDFL